MSQEHSQPSPASPAMTTTVSFPVFVGIDWADEEHAVCVLDGDRVRHEKLEHSPEAIGEWVGRLSREFGGGIAVALEQSHGGLAHALMQYEQLVLFPINPKQAARYREALSNSGKKDDPADAEALARFVREHHGLLRAWRPNDEPTRQLGRLVELRRKTVEMRKRTVQQLTSILKLYFPQALDLVGELHHPMALEMLRRWPKLKELQRANPATLRRFFQQYGRRTEEAINSLIAQIRDLKPLTTDRAIIDPNAMFVVMLVKQIAPLNDAVQGFDKEIEKLFGTHADASVFRSLPGAGAALAPRLLTAFGSDRERFASAEEVQCYSGIAPVTKRSGKYCHVHRRYACAKFLRQTFHEFANQARKFSPWSRAYYRHLRATGHDHHAAIRCLAYKWIRIIFRLWKDGTTYDQTRYLAQLQKKQVSYFGTIQPT